LIIPMIIQSIELHPLGPDQTEATPNMSRQFPSRSGQPDAELLPRN